MNSQVCRLMLASFVVVGVAAAVFHSARVAVADTPDADPAVVARWEHAALTHDGPEVGGNRKLSGQIVKMGDDGWELVAVTTAIAEGTTIKTTFYFKRPKQ